MRPEERQGPKTLVFEPVIIAPNWQNFVSGTYEGLRVTRLPGDLIHMAGNLTLPTLAVGNETLFDLPEQFRPRTSLVAAAMSTANVGLCVYVVSTGQVVMQDPGATQSIVGINMTWISDYSAP